MSTSGGSGLAARIIAIATLATAVAVGLGAAAVWWFGRPAPPPSEDSALERSFAAHTTFQQERFQRLELAARLLAEDRVLIAALVEPEEAATDSDEEAGAAVDSEQLSSVLRRRLSRLGCDVALLVSTDGRVLARSDSRPTDSSGGLAATIGGPADDPSAAVWEEEGRLYYTARAPVAPDFQYYAVAALAVDDLLALEIERAGGAEVAFFSASPLGPQLVGTSAPERSSTLLGQIGGLGGPGGLLEGVLAGRGPVPESDFTAGGVTYRGLLAPLGNASGEPAGAVVLFAPPPEVATSSRVPALIALGAGGLLGLLLAAPLAMAAARRASGPVGKLVDSVDAVRAGDPSQRTAGFAKGALAPLARSLDRLFGDLHERRSLSAVAAAAARGESSQGEAAPPPESSRRTLVAVDMRRFAAPGDRTDEMIARWQRDVQRFASLVRAGGGDFEGALGHRILGSFGGTEAAERALTAAASALGALSEQENAFDDGDPPALAVAEGKILHGTVTTAAGSSRVVAGSTLQLLESLLREAEAGEVVVSPPLVRRLQELWRRTGVEPAERPGLLTPRPVPVLTLAAAQQLAARGPRSSDDTRLETPAAIGGPRAPAAAGVEAPSEPDSLGAGDSVGGRFEVVEALGAGASGALLRARDRELGQLVTLQVLRPDSVADPAAFERLDSPLQPVRKLDHPSIVRTYDYGRAGELVFFAREAVGGTPLARLLGSHGRLPVAAALGLARQLAEGVGAAHLDGVPHGRLTPDNVILGHDGRARISDFGVGMALAEADAGSEPSLPPEGGITPAGDVYAVAALTLRAISGGWPQAGEPLPEGLPDELATVLASALAPEPASRPADGRALAHALDAVFA